MFVLRMWQIGKTFTLFLFPMSKGDRTIITYPVFTNSYVISYKDVFFFSIGKETHVLKFDKEVKSF